MECSLHQKLLSPPQVRGVNNLLNEHAWARACFLFATSIPSVSDSYILSQGIFELFAVFMTVKGNIHG